MTEEYLGIVEVARLLGVSRQRVWQRNKDRAMPEPVMLIGGRRPVWTREQIERWMAGE